MSINLQEILDDLQRYQRIIVAYSGGLDSCALLHLVATRYPDKTQAVHVHHNLSPNADAWAKHCREFCQNLNVPCVIEAINVRTSEGLSIEAEARDQRYAVLLAMMDSGDVLLTAHTQDDQAETLLLQLFRGAGPKGLSAMPSLNRFGLGHHARPFLGCTRAQLENYVDANGLGYIIDESNANERFDRNYLRHQVLPLIKARWPSASSAIARSAEHCATSALLIDSIAELDHQFAGGTKAGSLSISALQSLDVLRQYQLLRYWLHRSGVKMPSFVQLQEIVRQFIHSSQDSQPHITLGPYELRRYEDDLFVLHTLAPFDPNIELSWRLDTDLTLPSGLGVLSRAKLSHPNLPDEVLVRFRRGGERARLPGRANSTTLKQLFHEWGVPPWLRSRIPLIYVGDQLLEVPGYAIFDQNDQ